MRDRARELEELQEASRKHGGAREDQPELEAELQALQGEFQQLLTPLEQRRGKLDASKAVHQFYRDLANELVRRNQRGKKNTPLSSNDWLNNSRANRDSRFHRFQNYNPKNHL